MGEDDPDEIDEVGVDTIGNIEYRLKENKFKYEKQSNDHKASKNNKEKVKRIFVQQIELAMNERRNQRIIVYVDRRNPEYVISEDQCKQYIIDNYGQNHKDDDDEEITLSEKMKKQRKNDKKKTWKDTLYFVQSPNKLYSEVPK